MMTPDEKDIVRRLVAHYLDTSTIHTEMEMFWWNYGSEQLSDELPWADDPDRAEELMRVADRAERIARARRCPARRGRKVAMKDLIADYLPWLLSAITIYSMLLAGNKRRGAWLVGLVNQALWLIWILLTGSWGLLPMNVALWVVYARNYVRWKPDESRAG